MQFSVPRAMGGAVTVTGEGDVMGDPQTGLFALSLAAMLVHSNCAMRHDGTEIVFTVDGQPSVEVGFELFATDEESIAVSGTFDGALRWATDDGRHGFCGIDLDVATVLELDETGPNVTLTGVACDLDVMESESGLFDI